MRSTYAAAINKPRTVVGIDRGMLAVAVVLSSVLAAKDHQVFAVGLFFGLCCAAIRLTRRDAQFLQILPLVWKQRPIYDPGKRAFFREEIS